MCAEIAVPDDDWYIEARSSRSTSTLLREYLIRTKTALEKYCKRRSSTSVAAWDGSAAPSRSAEGTGVGPGQAAWRLLQVKATLTMY
jgi:hypothetical protein